MDCRDVQSLLPAHGEGRLDPETREAVTRHLQVCCACRAALARRDSLAGLFAGLAETPPPVDLAARVMTAAADQRRIAAARTRAAAVACDWNPWHWWRAATATLRWASVALAFAGAALGIVAGKLALEPAAPGAASSVDPLADHAIDFLAEAPGGSLAGSYAALLEPDGEGR